MSGLGRFPISIVSRPPSLHRLYSTAPPPPATAKIAVLRAEEKLHTTISDKIPMNGILIAELAHLLPDDIMETLPSGLLRFLKSHPSLYLLKPSGSGTMVKRFLQLRSGVVYEKRNDRRSVVAKRRTSLVRQASSAAAPTACQENTASTNTTAAILPLLQLWRVFKFALGEAFQLSSSSQQFVQLLRAASELKCVYGLIERIDTQSTQTAEVTASFLWTDEVEDAVLLQYLAKAEVLFGKSDASTSADSSSQRDDGVCCASPMIAGSMECRNASSSLWEGEEQMYRHRFFVAANERDVLVLRLLASLAQPEKSPPSPSRAAIFSYVDSLEWETARDYDAFRLSPYLHPGADTPLINFFSRKEAAEGGSDPTLCDVTSSLSASLAVTLAVFAAQQQLGQIPYSRHLPSGCVKESSAASVFEWMLDARGWVVAVRFHLEEHACLPPESFRSVDDLSSELSTVLRELKEVKKLRRCGAFQRRLALTNRRKQLILCLNIQRDCRRYSLYHPDVLAYYIYDRLPSAYESSGVHSKMIFPYCEVSTLLPLPLDRQAPVSCSLLRRYPHLFVLFFVQAQRVVVRRDVFDEAVEVSKGIISRHSKGQAMLQGGEVENLATLLFDPAARISTAEELVLYLAHLLALRKGRKKKYAGTYPVSLESLREMLPRSVCAVVRSSIKSAIPNAVVTASGANTLSAERSSLLLFLRMHPESFSICMDDTHVQLSSELDDEVEPSSGQRGDKGVKL